MGWAIGGNTLNSDAISIHDTITELLASEVMLMMAVGTSSGVDFMGHWQQGSLKGT